MPECCQLIVHMEHSVFQGCINQVLYIETCIEFFLNLRDLRQTVNKRSAVADWTLKLSIKFNDISYSDICTLDLSRRGVNIVFDHDVKGCRYCL